MNRIKVVYISQATGGVQRHIISLLERFNRERFEVAAICPPRDLVRGVSYDKESFVDALKRIGVMVYPVVMHREIRPLSDLWAFLRIYNIIRKEGFDIVHTHSSKAGFLGRIAARLAGVPVVAHTPHSFAFDRPLSILLERGWYIILEMIAGLFCDKVIAVCEGEKRLAMRFLAAPEKKIEVISNAADLADYDLKFDKAKKREELGMRQADKVVVFVGRFARQKAPLDFIKAADETVRVFPNVKFLMLGDGPLLKKAKEALEKKKLSHFVKILSWRNDAKEVISVSDIFVLPSLWEVLPNYSLLDAMALAKPIVATDTLGARDLVMDRYNGFVTARGKPILLARAIIKLLKLDEAALKEYGLRSRGILEKRPGLNATVKRIEGLYERLLYEKR